VRVVEINCAYNWKVFKLSTQLPATIATIITTPTNHAPITTTHTTATTATAIAIATGPKCAFPVTNNLKNRTMQLQLSPTSSVDHESGPAQAEQSS